MSTLDRVRMRCEVDGYDEDELLEDLILSAQDIYFELKGPFCTETEVPAKYNSWLVSCAVELYNKIGIEGQTGHHENSVIRTYDSGDISLGLKSRIVPTVGFA